MLRDREVSATEVMQAHLARTASLNSQLNAVVTLVAERALAKAEEADTALMRGDQVGPLHGLPVAHKDLFLTKGLRTTFGSPIFESFIPDQNSIIVERLQSAGAIAIGKTNTPEFGAGSQTFNTVFGPTRNPWNLDKTCGGSSGGSAVALATGMVCLADGSDMGGSIRNPASFCNVVGLRPSPGQVPVWPNRTAWFPSPSVAGPMARTVADVKLMLEAIVGADPRDPLSFDDSNAVASTCLDRDLTDIRIAWSQNLGGLPVEPAVTTALEKQRPTFEQLGCIVEDATPDLSDADEIFRTWRAWYYELEHGELLRSHRSQLKDTVIWNIEAGQRLSGVQLGNMARRHAQLHHRMNSFMDTYEFLVLPVTQVTPFDITKPYITEINGTKMTTYLDWMRSCYYISVTGLPAISVPCGFTSDGLPVGIQIVGRHRHDIGLLQLAHAFEQATGFWQQRPPIVNAARDNESYG